MGRSQRGEKEQAREEVKGERKWEKGEESRGKENARNLSVKEIVRVLGSSV